MAKKLSEKELKEWEDIVGIEGLSLIAWLATSAEAIDETVSAKQNLEEGKE